jgi:hypothetical protein
LAEKERLGSVETKLKAKRKERAREKNKIEAA